MPPEIAAPRDAPYLGTLTLSVDATDLKRRIFRVKEHIPVHGGPVTLLYPKWIPGKHWPAGRIDSVAGLVVTANGIRIDGTGIRAMDFIVTVVWIVAITNAVNFLDNMDGLSAGATAIAAVMELVNEIYLYPAPF